MRILLVEDDRSLSEHLCSALIKAGYVVDLANDGEEGLFLGMTEPDDAAILDLNLPKIDGFAVLATWRQEQIKLPVIVLSARSSWREKVAGLRSGADDYIAKPFEIEELLARLEAILRRASGHADTIISYGSLKLDQATKRVTFNGKNVELTALEYRALSYLMFHQGNIVSKAELTEHIYSQDFDRDSNVIEVIINHLRRKLGKNLIKTHRGMGYQLIDHATS